MKETIYYYEKSLELPKNERDYLDMHGIDIYAAKAYQMMGDRNRSLSILTGALQNMRNKGKYEEIWSGYLFAAEIHFQNASIDRANGESATYETTMKYFTLADEYAPLYRKTNFQMQWAKMQRLTYSLMFADGPKQDIIREIDVSLDKSGNYLKSVVLARLMGFFAAVKDSANAVKCAKQCIEVGEAAGMLLHSALAYGILARAAIAAGEKEEALHDTQRYLRLCSDNGIYEYFKARKDYDPILQFASDNEIEAEITKEMMEFSGYKTKKAYIKTFGGFTVFPYNDRKNALKMRTRKERELLAFLLDAGEQGVTKEQICDAIWSESESDNVKRLIGVNLTQIKKDLFNLGIESPIICRERRYCICRDEIVCDFEQFENAAAKIENAASHEEMLQVLSLYSGEYLSDFEAFWATSKRIKYREIHNANFNFGIMSTDSEDN
jgi:LuxR family transcriptional regulator, maltose regulon positive regulatory protein